MAVNYGILVLLRGSAMVSCANLRADGKIKKFLVAKFFFNFFIFSTDRLCKKGSRKIHLPTN